MRDKDLLKLLKKRLGSKASKRKSPCYAKGDKIQIVAVHNKDVPIGLLEKILKGDRAKISPLSIYLYKEVHYVIYLSCYFFIKNNSLLGRISRPRRLPNIWRYF